MNDKELEQLLRHAPSPVIPPGLSERLEDVFDRPQESGAAERPRGFRLRYLIPAASLAASLAVLAGVLFWPAPLA
ncbi:MAG: hypothetical protein WD490_05590, partial [Opitutales bacterium]